MGQLQNNIYKVIGFIGIPITVYNLYYFRGNLNPILTMWLVFLGISFSTSFLFDKGYKLTPKHIILSTAILSSVLIYLLFPSVFVDDTGFVIRYFSQASDGCFYCYNASDGPVYGISSFLYGFVGSILAMPGILAPENIIFILNFTGLVILLNLIIKILHHYIKDMFVVLLSFIFICFASVKFVSSTTIGLETNFHLAIVFAAVYFFIKDERKWMLLFMALSVISKLDTVPLMLALAGIHFINFRKDFFGVEWLKNWILVLKFAILPVLIFIGITFILFDGPLPQSAYAKIYHHPNPSEHWFPFWELMYDKGERMSLMKMGFAFIGLHGIVSILNKNFKLKDFALFGGYVGTMVLFYLYNPAERMRWYYALPELLFFLQMIISIAITFQTSNSLLRIKHAFLFIGLSIAAFPLISGEKPWNDRNIQTVEVERMELGHYIAKSMSGNDTIVASHGYFGAYTKGYVFDLSGLNSKLATDYKRNLDSVILDFKPSWYIHHGDQYLFDIANKYGYTLDTAAFNINQYNYPTWTLFKRNDSEVDIKLGRLPVDRASAERIEPHGITYAAIGNKIELTLGSSSVDSIGIWFGAAANFEAEGTFEIPYRFGNQTGAFKVQGRNPSLLPNKEITSTHIVIPMDTTSRNKKLIIESDKSIKVFDPIIVAYK